MRKRVAFSHSITLVAIILLLVSVPNCQPTEQGTINVQATLCGVPWQGAVNYTLSTPGGALPLNGAEAPKSYVVEAGSWTCAYVSGGPSGSYLASITPSDTQSVEEGSTITFTLNFELEQDAAAEFLAWTVNGEPIGETGRIPEYEAVPCQIIDVHFGECVNGCQAHKATVNETSWLEITQRDGPAGVKIWVFNEDCAVMSTPPPQGLPPVKKSQVPSINGQPVQQGTMIELPPPLLPVTTTLDVGTVWELAKSLNYTQSIKWLGISRYPFEPPGHECVLFELVVPGPGIYKFTLVAFTEVMLLDCEDTNPGNNRVESPPLTLTVNVP